MDTPRATPPHHETSASSSGEVPRLFGRYTLLSRLGRGGFGTVWRAWDPQTARHVALKVLRAPLDDPDDRARFVREATVIARLRHRNVVTVHDAGEDDGVPYFAMELVEGESFEEALRVGRLDVPAIVAIVRDVALGLAHAHAHGILHRDLKPANVLLGHGGRTVLSDFGLARWSSAREQLTRTGEVLGTPAYMAPEQVDRGVAPQGPPTDVYGLGATLYRAVTGRPPFIEHASMLTLMTMILSDEPTPPRELAPDVPAGVEAILRRCLEKDPADRYATASALAADLDRFLQGRPPEALETDREQRRRQRLSLVGASRRRTIGGLVAVVVAGLALAVLVIALAGRRGSTPDPVAGRSGSEATTAPVDHGPLPPPGEGWERRWSLGEGAPPALEPAISWNDEGRSVDPLGVVRDGAGSEDLVAALGDAVDVELLDDGRVRARYDTSGLGRPRFLQPILFARGGALPIITHDGAGASPTITAPNDAGAVVFTVGRGRWIEPRVRVRLTAAREVDHDSVFLRAWPARRESFVLDGRSGIARFGGGEQAVPFDLVVNHDLTLEIDTGDGGRITLDGRHLDALDRSLASLHTLEPTPVLVGLSEAAWRIASIEITGRLARADRPARATVRGPALSTTARVAVAFEVDGEGSGGPFVEIGTPAGERLVAELDGTRLVVRLGDVELGAAEVAASTRRPSGVLVLERRDDILRAEATVRAADGDDETGVVEVALPWPVAVHEAAAAWGSTAPRVRFDAVAVDVGGGDDDRSSADAAIARGASLDEIAAILDPDAIVDDPGRRGRRCWRLGAERLARVTDPERVPPALVGPSGDPPDHTERRRRTRRRGVLAREALALLEEAAERLDDPVARSDVLARACVAAVVAGQPDAAEALLRGLLRACPSREVARERLDRLEPGRPVDGWVESFSRGSGVAALEVEIADAGLRVAAGLVEPQLVGKILYQRAEVAHVRARNVTSGPITGAPPRAVVDHGERALALLAEAARATPWETSEYRVARCRGEVLVTLGRWANARDALRSAIEHSPRPEWYLHSQLAHSLGALEQPEEACLEALTAFGLAPRQMASQLERLGADLHQARLLGRGDVVLLLARTVSGVGRDEVIDHAERMLNAGAVGVEADFALYAILRAGGVPPPDAEPGAGPGGDLVRARLAALRGDADEARRLLRSARRDRFVAAFVALDPELEGL